MSEGGQRGRRDGSPAPQPREAVKWTPRMDEAYEAVVQRLGGLDQCKPKAVLQQLQSDQPGLFAEMDVQRVKWKLMSHRRREMRHRAMAPQGIAPPTKWSGRREEAYEEAVAQLGGIHRAQPKMVLERLQPEFPDLTLEVIKWHLQGQRRRERRLASRSVSTQPSSSQHEEQPHEGEEAARGEEQEEQGNASRQNSRQPRPRPPRLRQRAVSATPETAATAMSAAGGSDGEEEAAPRQQAQPAAQQQAQPRAGMPQPQHWLQPPLPPQWALEQQLLQQVVAQQFGQVPSVPAPLLQQQQAQRPAIMPPLQGAALPPEAVFIGAAAPSAPLSLAAGMLCAGGPEWAPYTLPAACSGLKKAQHARAIAAQLVLLLEDQRARLEQLVPVLVAAEAAQGPSSSSGGSLGVDPLSQLLQTAQLLPAGQPWSTLASGIATLPPTAAPDAMPVSLKRQPRAVLAAAAAFPLHSPSPAVGLPHSGGGGGSRSSEESGEDHLLTCAIPNCRRCAYERRLQGAKQQLAGGAPEREQQQQPQQPPQPQPQQPQQAPAPPAEGLDAGIASESLLGIADPVLVKLLGSLLGSMPPMQVAKEEATF